MSELDDGSRSCIKTECVIPNGVILPWVLSRFPELAHDAKLVGIDTTYRGGHKFTVEHTVQAVKPAGPIMLSPPGDDE
jgi:hypothetical protein